MPCINILYWIIDINAHAGSHAARLVCEQVAESLPAGSGEDWLCWRALEGRAKTVTRRWGYFDDTQSVDGFRLRGATDDLLSCRLLDEVCTADDLATVTERAKACARKWDKIV